jgi:hypothetical protein
MKLLQGTSCLAVLIGQVEEDGGYVALRNYMMSWAVNLQRYVKSTAALPVIALLELSDVVLARHLVCT